MKSPTVSTSFSSDAVKYLLRHGMSRAALASMLGVTNAFIDRVKSGRRGLTIDHMIALERATGKSLPLLMIEETPRAEVPPDLRPLYDATKRVFRSSLALRKSLIPTRSNRRMNAAAPKPQRWVAKRRRS